MIEATVPQNVLDLVAAGARLLRGFLLGGVLGALKEGLPARPHVAVAGRCAFMLLNLLGLLLKKLVDRL